jgi:phosphoserine phosphatase
MALITLVGDGLSTADVDAARAIVADLGGQATGWRWLDEGWAADIDCDGSPAPLLRDAIERELGGLDVIVQDRSARQRRLFVADMDSTMIKVECIDELADYAGVKADVAAVTEAAMRGEIDFAEALQARVALLKGLPVDIIARCIDERVRMSPGARTLVATLNERGLHTLLVSGGFTAFTDVVAGELGFAEARANRLRVEAGCLTGEVEAPIIDASAKLQALQEAAQRLGTDAYAAIGIGDGANDLPMVTAAGLGIAYHAKPALSAAADVRIRRGDLTVVLAALGIARREWVRPRSGRLD